MKRPPDIPSMHLGRNIPQITEQEGDFILSALVSIVPDIRKKVSKIMGE